MKLSEWQPMSKLPEIDGIYQRETPIDTYFSMFKNGKWYYGYHSVELAFDCPANQLINIDLKSSLRWRGVIEE